MQRLTRFLTTGALLSALAVPSAAVADQPQRGVHVDPGSPAGKQYAFPVSSARSEAAGNSGSGSGSGGSGSSNPPLFGAGASAGGSGSGGSGSGGSGSGGSGSSSGATHHSTSASHAKSVGAGGRKRQSFVTPDPAQVAINAAAPLGSAVEPPRAVTGGSAWVPLTIGGVLVLVLGGGIGVAMRRRESNAGD
jgi:hypothetical protein